MEINFKQDQKKSTAMLYLSWTCCELVLKIEKFLSLRQVHNICNMFRTSATCSQQLSHNAFTSSAKQSHNHYNTYTTNLRLMPGKSITILTTRLLLPHNNMTTSPQPPCIMCVQYIGGCSVPRGCSVHRGDIMSTLGGYYEYIGRCSVHRGDIMMNVGDTMSTLGDVQYIGGIP